MKTLIIDEKFWGRADYNPDGKDFEGKLNDRNGKMCCLGFVSQACGVTKRAMLGNGLPRDLDAEDRDKVNADYPWLFQDGPLGTVSASSDAFSLAEINDAIEIKTSEKRKRIREIFKKHGVRVVFKRA